MDIRSIFLIILAFLVVALSYLIMSGSLFHCSPVKCPNNCPDPIRSYLS